MGAIVFWILLGIASGTSSNLDATTEDSAPGSPDSELPPFKTNFLPGE